MARGAVLSDRRWRLVLPLGIALLLSLSGDLTLYAVLPAYAPTLGLSLASVGLLLSANRLVRLASNPVVGLLFDRLGRRRLFLAGMALGTLSTFCYALTQQFTIFLLARLLWGVSWSLINVGAFSMIIDVTDHKDRGWSTGLLQVFYYAGLSINPLLGGALTDRFGFVPAMLVCTLLMGLGLLVAWGLLPETAASAVARSASRPPGGLPGRAMLQLMRRRSLVIAAYIYLLLHLVSEGVVMSTVSLYLRQQFGAHLSLGGMVVGVALAGGAVLALLSLVSALVAPLVGRLSDSSDNRWRPVAGGIAVGVGGIALMGLVPSLGGLLLGVALVAVSVGVLRTVLPGLVGDQAPPDRRGTLMGGLMTAGDIGSAAGPLAAYALVGFIPLSSVYLAAAIVMATSLALPSFAYAPHRMGEERISALEE